MGTKADKKAAKGKGGPPGGGAAVWALRKAENEAKKAVAAASLAAADAAGLGAAEEKGDSRGTMEDRVVVCRLAGGARFAGAYDGHIGEGCAAYAGAHLHGSLEASEDFKAGRLSMALVGALEETHKRFRGSDTGDSGATATVACISGRTLHVASFGNCRAVICSRGGALALTKDVIPDIPHRGLIGTEQLEAQVVERALTADDRFIIVASDGVWGVIDNSTACAVVSRALDEYPLSPHKAAKALVVSAYERSTDNSARHAEPSGALARALSVA